MEVKKEEWYFGTLAKSRNCGRTLDLVLAKLKFVE